MKDEQEIKLKIIILGKTEVGKTCILNRYFNNLFSYSSLPTIGMECYTKNYTINSNNVTFNFFDTAGQEKYNSIVTNYLRNANGVILVYDITKEDSFEKIKMWVDQLKDKNDTNSIILLGNKSDLNTKRVISKEEGIKLAEKLNCDFFEVSALSNENISDAIEKIVNITYKNYLKEKNKNNNESIIVDMRNTNKKNAVKVILFYWIQK